MQAADTNTITIDPDEADRAFPIPAETFDIFVGQVVHQGLSSLEWGEWVVARVRQRAAGVPERLVPFLEAFVNAAEDIYLDELCRSRVWSLYLLNSWKTESRRDARDPALPPSASSLALTWRTRETTGFLPRGLHHDYNEPLERLRDCAPAIREVATTLSPAERREKRVDLYLRTWTGLQEILSEWEAFGSSPAAIPLFDEAARERRLPNPQKRDAREDESEGGETEHFSGLDQELAEEVMKLVEEGETDVTRTLLVAVEDPEAGSMRTRVRLGTARMAVQPDPLLVKQLRRVFTEQESRIRRARRRRIRRGLVEGKLDPLRLHRVPMDGKAFKSREPPAQEHAWQILLVADASASMAGKGVRQKSWPIAEKAFASLAEASRGSRNRVDIYAYHEEKDVCTLTRLYHGGDLYTVVPSGRTPSGQAILAAAVTLPESRSRNILIHITDGASNCGVRLTDAVGFCSRNGIELFTIGCGCSRQTKDFLRECFSADRLFFLKDIRTLPLVLERLLRQRILFSIR
jgi:hypothetical protein